jgi:hypothetical protein
VDCDDTNAAVRPSATENCSDGIDNNCNGLIDDLDPAALGCQALALDINLSPTAVNFGSAQIGDSIAQDIVIQNRGTAAVTINSVSHCTETSTEFSWVPAAPFILPAKTSMTLSVIYAPLDEGTDTGCLTISTNDSDESTVEVTLQAAGVLHKSSILPFLPLLLNTTGQQNR